MSFLHIHLIWICHFSTPIWSGYVIPPHVSGPDMSRNDITGADGCGGNKISGPYVCGGMTYVDQMYVEE
jgi:hypothetical protein